MVRSIAHFDNFIKMDNFGCEQMHAFEFLPPASNWLLWLCLPLFNLCNGPISLIKGILYLAILSLFFFLTALRTSCVSQGIFS